MTVFPIIGRHASPNAFRELNGRVAEVICQHSPCTFSQGGGGGGGKGLWTMHANSPSAPSLLSPIGRFYNMFVKIQIRV